MDTLPTTASDSSRFIQAALAASDDCIKIVGLDGSLQYMSEGGQRVMEVDDFNTLRGCPWPDFWKDGGNLDAVAAIESARQGRSARFTGYANTAKGNRRYWDVQVSPIRAEDGSVESILSVSRDITALKAFEEQQVLLRAEMAHRIKNILALVNAVASQTLRDGDDMARARPAFLARLVALGQAHDLLTTTQHAATDLRSVVEAVVQEPSERIVVRGPHVALGSRSGLAIALATHELMTNAVKYGALSSDAGQVEIAWVATDGDLDFRWTERHGPVVVEPTRRGFGTVMIERALAGYVDGDTRLTYPPSGLLFELRASLETLRAS